MQLKVPQALNQKINKLNHAIRHRNDQAVKTLLAENVKFTNGPVFGQSLVEFHSMKNKTAVIWQDLKNVMSTDGDFMQDNSSIYCFPYISARYSKEMENHAFEYFVADTQGKLFAKPNDISEIADISYEFVKLAVDSLSQQTEAWSRITTLDGIKGYVKSSALLWPTGPLVCFSETQEKEWEITLLFGAND